MLAALALPVPAARADETVTAGALRVTIAASPFAITATDAAGRPVLTGGTLRADRLAGTATAQRAAVVHRDGDAVVADVTLTDGGTLRLRVTPAGEGVVALTAAPTGVTTPVAGLSVLFDAARREVFSGFGERSNALDFRGKDVQDYVADGPFRPEDRLYVKAITPPWGATDRDDDTYYPVPWLLSGRGYGVLLDNDETSRFDLGKTDPGRWSASVDASELRLRIFAGPTPADALRRFTAATGRQPAPDASWVYGPWVQSGQPNVIPPAEERGIVKALRDADAPVSALETQMHYLPCGAQRGQETAERTRVAQSHAAGLAHLAYLNPHLCMSYQPVYDAAVRAGVLQKATITGGPWAYPAFVGGGGPLGFTDEPIAQFDFTAPGTEAFVGRLVQELADAGKDGWMEDFGEYTPPFIASADGTPSAQLHNRYPRDYHCALQRIAERLGRPVTRHQRSGWTGAAKCASIVWGGDPTTVWGYDGLLSAVRQVQSMGLSGVARWGTDIGGYNSFGPAEQLSRELLHRWIQFGAVVPTMRTKRTGLAVPSYTRPQVFDTASLPIWRRYAKLHTQLYPYLQAADAAYRRTGMPIVRAGMLTDPGDAAVVGAEGQFGFGPDLLAAPVTSPGRTTQRVQLPAGEWVDWWRTVHYDADGDGAFLPDGARVLPGGQAVTLPAPADQLPLLVRAGSVLPLLPADVDTLAPYEAKGVVTLADRAHDLTLLAFPRGSRSATFGARGERLRSVETRGRWTLTVDGKVRRRYTVRAALGTLRRPFAPCRVAVGMRTLPRSAWRYDRATRALTVRFRATDATLRVRGC